MGDREAVLRVEPMPGAPWCSVSFSLGHVLADDTAWVLRACPATDCPVLGRPQDSQLVPVTGRLTDASGRAWYRVEFRHPGPPPRRLALSPKPRLGTGRAAGSPSPPTRVSGRPRTVGWHVRGIDKDDLSHLNGACCRSYSQTSDRCVI